MADNSTRPSHRTFTLFPQLAPELRNEIWRLALPGPRIIQLYTEVDTWSLHLLGCLLEYFLVDHRSYGNRHPAVLSVNRESRGVALRHLTERFHCYWNLKSDVAYIRKGRRRSGMAFRNLGELDEGMLEELRGMRLLDGFRNLAIDCGSWNDGQLSKCITTVGFTPNLTQNTVFLPNPDRHARLDDGSMLWALQPLDQLAQMGLESHDESSQMIRKFEKCSRRSPVGPEEGLREKKYYCGKEK